MPTEMSGPTSKMPEFAVLLFSVFQNSGIPRVYMIKIYPI